MNKSSNYGMNLPQGNNVVDIDVLNANINNIDKGLSPFYVATQSGSNVYKVTTGLNKTTLANGYGIRVAIPSDSNGAVNIIIDTCNAVAVKKPNGNAVTNFKANGVYSLTYYNSVFILASGGVDDVNFSASDLLENKSANNSDGEKVNGTMKNVGQQTATINAGGKVVITKGYHDGTGYIQSNSMGKQLTDLGVTLTSANQLVKDVKAVDKNGNLITGTATIESLGGIKGKKLKYNKGDTIPIQSDAKYMLFTADGPNYQYHHILLEISNLKKNTKYYAVPNHCFVSSGIYAGKFQVITNDDCSSCVFVDDYNDLNYILVTIIY